jgi:nitroimidazol reductase NimA-like FMN-containing flavoprotein (pyridoxamine 5'-phosphate oxidase superfamily)
MSSATRELTSGECWERLRSAIVGRIAYLDEHTGIEIFPVNFVVDHGTIVLRTAEGRKLTALAERPHVVFEADGGDPGDSTGWAVTVHGTAESIDGHDDVVDAFDLELTTWHGAAKPHFVRVVPRDIVGHHAVASDTSTTTPT